MIAPHLFFRNVELFSFSEQKVNYIRVINLKYEFLFI